MSAGPDMNPPVPNAHPIVRFIYEKCVEQKKPRTQLARQAGVSANTLHNWWHRRSAISLASIEACLQVLGYEIRPYRQEAVRPEFIQPSQLRTKRTLLRETRCGEMVVLTSEDERFFYGATVKCDIKMRWNKAGKRVPAVGDTDPFDLLRPLKDQEQAA